MNSYDPANLFRLMMQGQTSTPAPGPSEALQRRAHTYQTTGADPGAQTPPADDPAETEMQKLLKGMLGGPSDGAASGMNSIAPGRPDGMGGINHQGRFRETGENVMMKLMGGGGGK